MTHKTPPLWKQLAGALVGASLSLVMYQGWKTTSPHLTAWLSVPETTSELPVELSDYDGATEEQFERIARRAREISMKFENVHGAPTVTVEPLAPIPEAANEEESLPPNPDPMDEDIYKIEEDLYPNDEPHGIDPIDEPVQDLPNDPLPEPIRYPSAEVVRPEVVAPSLPSSGVGVLAGGVTVLGAAAGWFRSRKKGTV